GRAEITAPGQVLDAWPLEKGASMPHVTMTCLVSAAIMAFHHGTISEAPPAAAAARRGGEWRALALLAPYLWEFRGRVVIALAFLIPAKLANVGVPLVLKEIVDGLDPPRALLALPLALLAAYGVLRLSTTLFAELRDLVFVRVTQRAVRRIAL